MKKRMIGKVALIMAATILLTVLTGCSGKDESAAGGDYVIEVLGDTMGTKFVYAFNSLPCKEPNEMADALLANVKTDYELVKMDVEPGYLNGFDAEIDGFDEGVMISPMIGSIPVVGYVFKTSDASALMTKLNENANPRWNICTEADETVAANRDNLVFFMMCTNEEQ